MLRPGPYCATAVDTTTGRAIWHGAAAQTGDGPSFTLTGLRSDLAVLVRALPIG